MGKKKEIEEDTGKNLGLEVETKKGKETRGEGKKALTQEIK